MDTALIISIIISVYLIFWTIQMRNYVRKIRVMMSMQLQVMQQIAKEKGININLEQIAKDIEKVVK